MTLTNPISVPWEAFEDDLPRIYREFLAIAGQKNVIKRLNWISAQIQDPFWREYVSDKYFLERALLSVRTHFDRYGRLPSCQSPATYKLYGFMFAITAVHSLHRQVSVNSKGEFAMV